MYNEFRGKVALITGGGSGIGLATALLFAKDGAKVVIADMSVDRGNAAVEEIKAIGGEAVYVKTDVSDPESCRQMVEKTVECFGRLDYACNSAGIFCRALPLDQQPLDMVNKVIDIDLMGIYNCLKYEAPEIAKQGKGAIVNVSSVQGMICYPGASPYAAAKAGVIHLSRAAAMDYIKAGVRVNCVSPASVRTPAINAAFKAQPEVEKAAMAALPIGRLSEPEELAHPIVWLCSDGASFVVGHNLVVDGGKTVE